QTATRAGAPNDLHGAGHPHLLFQLLTHPTPPPTGSTTPGPRIPTDVLIDLMNGTSIVSSTTITNTPGLKVVADGDFNADGKVDLVLQNTTSGAPQIWLMNGASIASKVTNLPVPPPSWHIIASGDFNGDGNADILWQNSNATPAIWLMNAPSILTSFDLPTPPISWKVILAGDLNAHAT